MAGWQDLERIALSLPGAVADDSGPTLAYRVGRHAFVWERPLRRPDRAALGDAAPDGPVLGVRTADQGAKLALLADALPGVFTIPHYEGWPLLLVALDVVDVEVLAELVTEAWRARAGKRLLRAYDEASQP